MARKRKQPVASSGAPGITNGIGVALNPIGLQQAGAMPYGNFLDPNVALKEVPHPSSLWAGVELQPCKPRV
jgi:hypothetical protein